MMKAQAINLSKPSFWQLIFLQSKVNGAPYIGEWLPGRNWKWPENTYLRRRLEQLRRHRYSEYGDLNEFDDSRYNLVIDGLNQKECRN